MEITARVIIQMMGAPKKHIVSTLKMYIEKIKEEHKGIKILEEFKSKPKKEGKLFKVFTELELKAKDTSDLIWFCFDYMPSSVEVIDPTELIFKANDFTDFLNDLQDKLHRIDMNAKNLSAQNQVLNKNGRTLMMNLIMLQLRTKPVGIDILAKNAGAPNEHLQKFVDSMIKDGKIKKDNDVYRVA